MSLYRLKIKEKFLKSIREGKKTREYRLVTPERKNISVGDILVLLSNQDKNDFVKVTVEKKEFFKNWDEALSNYWESDFPDFDSIDSVKKECYKFYKKEDVDNCGIEVLHFSLFKKDVKNASVLLDTNIVIHRESSNNIAYEVMKLYNLMDKLKITKYLHEDVNDELSKHSNQKIKEAILSKMAAYNILPSLSIDDDYFSEIVQKYGDNDNSKIDNKFLYQVYKGKVDFFITEDKTLIQKARDLYLDDVVLSYTDFLKKIEELYPSMINYPVLSVKLTKIGTIDVNDHFFDSLREDYEGIKFNIWFKDKALEDAYIFNNKDGLQGFLYLKIENDDDYSDIEPPFKKARRLKVGTFKINSTGLRVGERFIKIIIDYALKSKVDEIYVTLFENKRQEVNALMELMMSWGFDRWGYKKSNHELVLVKKMNGKYNLTKNPKYNYPFCKDDIRYGILPIESQWHTNLFPDLYLKNENMSLYVERPCGYAIEKIYVCKGMPAVTSPGDIMIIYRIGNRFPAKYYSVASGYCIIQKVIYTKSFEEYKSVCSNKSVFNDAQLYYLYHSLKRRTVIKLLYVKAFEKKVIYGDMLSYNIIDKNEGPRLSTSLTKEQFNTLLKIGMKGD